MPLAFAGLTAPNPNAPPPRTLVHRWGVLDQVGAFLLLALPSAAKTETVSVSPDAGLLRLCAQFHDAHARSEAAPDDGQQWKVWLDRRWEFSNQIEDMVPRTDAGRQAKARVAVVLMMEAIDDTNDYERFILATLRDTAGSAAA